MGASMRDLRRKIRSIRGTAKITAAMQLVAASKMTRATKRATESRPYTDAAAALVAQIAPRVDPTGQPLFATRSVRTQLVLLVTSNRGLTGPLNIGLVRALLTWQGREARGGMVKIVAVGAKGRAWVLRYARESLLADFPAPDATPTFTEARPIAELLMDEFLAGRADAVHLAYNHFASTLRQEPVIQQFLPIGAGTTSEVLPRLLGSEGGADRSDVLLEPSQADILAALLPRVLRARIYQVLLETHASEQAARMVAMKNATDNAGDLLDDLTLTANSVRQASITGELLDIAAGTAALAA